MMPYDWSLSLSCLTLTEARECWMGAGQGFHPTSLRAPGGLGLTPTWLSSCWRSFEPSPRICVQCGCWPLALACVHFCHSDPVVELSLKWPIWYSAYLQHRADLSVSAGNRQCELNMWTFVLCSNTGSFSWVTAAVQGIFPILNEFLPSDFYFCH